MRIIDRELNILKISDIKKGTIPKGKIKCKNRHSDCFVYVLSGFAEYLFGKKIQTAEKGSIIYLAKSSDYGIKVKTDDYSFIYIDFLFESETDLENEIFKLPVLAELENTFIKLKRLWTQGSFADKIYCKSRLYKIYFEIVNENIYEYVPSAKRKQIEIAIKEITENFTEPDISIEKLSRDCNISEVHFRRLFHKIFHTSPMKFIISLRIGKAKEMLSNTDYQISYIAEECGFNTSYYFSKVFKESTGMTPGDYRLFSKMQ